MFNRLIIFIINIMCLGVFFISLAFGYPNLLPNGGFEITTVPDMPDFWDQYLGPKKVDNWSNYWSLDQTTVHSGRYSLRLHVIDKHHVGKIYAHNYLNNKILKLYKKPELSEKDTYILSLFLKSDKSNFKVRIKFYNKSTELQVNDKWQQFQIIKNNLDFEKKIYIIPEDVGTLWVDDVSLSKISANQKDSTLLKSWQLPSPLKRSKFYSRISNFSKEVNHGRAADTPTEPIKIKGQAFFYFGACCMHIHNYQYRWNQLLTRFKNWGYTVVIASFTEYWNLSRGSIESIRYFLDLALSKDLKVVIWIQPNAVKKSDGQLINVRNLPAKQALYEFKKEMDRLIPPLKNHPALLAWYVCDEPYIEDWIKSGLAKKMIDYAKSLDSTHPVFINYAAPLKHFRFYNEFLPGDIISVTQYPIPTQPITSLGYMVALANIMGHNKKPVIIWFQLWSGKGRYPTPLEFRCMIYLGVINGITGFQTWPMMPGSQILWSEVKNTISELRTIWPYILSQEKISITVEGTEYVYANSKLVKDKLYVIAVNTSKLPQKAILKINNAQIMNAKGRILFEKRDCEIVNKKIKDDFEPYERHVYVFLLNSTEQDERVIGPPNNIKIIK